jgi:protocatechuate 3,4-dioxygenase beta subunit
MGRGKSGWITGLATVLLVVGATERGWAQATVRGRVVDAAGAAVAGARVRLYRGNYEDSFYSSTLVLAGETVAKADGSFSFSTPPGQCTLQLATPRDQVAPWVAEPVALRIDPGELVEARIVVRSGGIWEIAVGETGSYRALAQARVSIRELDGITNVMSVTTDADGVARIRLLPGEYEIQSVQCEGYAYDGQRRTTTMADGETRRVALLLAPNLCGVVRDPEGLPVAGARVRIVGAGREEITSDEQGQFEIVWDRRYQFQDALTFYLVARHEPRNLATTMVIGREATWLDVRLQACPALAGRLTNPQGQGIAGAWTYVTLRVPNWGDTPLSEEATAAGADGRFQIRAVPPAALCTLHSDAAAYGSKDTAVPRGTATGLSLDIGTLTLPPANLSVSGRVLDSRGNPVANAMVYGWGEGQPIQLHAETDAQGWFTLDRVCAGQVNLRIDINLSDGRQLQIRTLANAGAAGLEIRSREPYNRVSQEH